MDPQITLDDMEIISADFVDPIIREGFGKRPAIHPFLFPPQFFFDSWPILMPGGGMSMWPALSLYLTTTGRYWSGVLRLPSQLASGRRGIGMRAT